MCLHIEIYEGQEMCDDCFVWAKNIIDSYLQASDGRVFFCNDRDIYIICKDVPFQTLKQAAQMICDLVYNQSGILTRNKIYDLCEDGPSFADGFFERVGSLDDVLHRNNHILERAHEYALSGLVNDMKQKKSSDVFGAPKVLLVEDDPITRFMVRKAVKDDCDLATAGEANKVFSVYASYQPDIVFLDINLPDGSGYDVLDWIMNNDPGACVVMFSGNGDIDNIVSSMGYGARGFVTKPFSKEKLLHYIHNFAG